MTTPRATPPVHTDPPDTAGAVAPAPDPTMRAGPAVASVSHAWDDQDIDTVGTEADAWFPMSDGSA